MTIDPGETATLLDQPGPGCVTHFYCALAFYELTDYRDAILRCYWDGERNPSVEVPLGDFFAIAHARVRPFHSQLVTVNPGGGSSHGLNAYFPMPFGDGARITLENRGDHRLGGMLPAFWYHIDYETYADPLPDATLRFHAQWRQEHPTAAVGSQPNVQLHDAVNLDGAENYTALEAFGEGQMVGLVLEVNNIAGGWYGEGDDMVFIDGEPWPPAIHGTGSEEIFGGGACPAVEYAGPYSGFHSSSPPSTQASSGCTVGIYTTRSGSEVPFVGQSNMVTPTTSRTSTARSPTGISPSHTPHSRPFPSAKR